MKILCDQSTNTCDDNLSRGILRPGNCRKKSLTTHRHGRWEQFEAKQLVYGRCASCTGPVHNSSSCHSTSLFLRTSLAYVCLFCMSIENTYSTLGIFIFLETHDIRNALIPMSEAEILSVLSYIRDPLSIPQSIFQLIYDRLEHLTLQIR